MTPDRQATVARIVRVAIATTPSIAAARRTLRQWPGHPSDPALRDDALGMLDRIEREARQEKA
jgi:hypothetical protein